MLEAGSLMTPQTLYRFDIFIKFEETDTLNSTFQMYIDGVLVYDKSDFVRFASASVGYERALYIGDSVVTTIAAFQGTYLSNIRVSSTDTRGKDFMSLPLDTVGTYNEFDLDGFAALADGTGKLMARSKTAAQRVSGTLDYASIPDNGAISEVKISSVFSVDSAAANPNALAHFIRVGTTNYDQALAEPVNFRDVLLTSLATNPDTAVAWALADLNGMQFGLLSGNIA